MAIIESATASVISTAIVYLANRAHSTILDYRNNRGMNKSRGCQPEQSEQKQSGD